MKVRDAQAVLKQAGGVLVRITGSHYIFRMPDGGTVILTGNHMNADVGPGLRRKIERAVAGLDNRISA